MIAGIGATMDIPTSKTKIPKGQIFFQLTLLVQPAVWLKSIRIRIGHWVFRDAPASVLVNVEDSKSLCLPVTSNDRGAGRNDVIILRVIS